MIVAISGKSLPPLKWIARFPRNRDGDLTGRDAEAADEPGHDLWGAGSSVSKQDRGPDVVGGGMMIGVYEITPIGRVESPLVERAMAPKQGDEGAPDSWLVFEPQVGEGLLNVRAGQDVFVLTWLDRAARDVLRCARAAKARGP